MLVSISDGESGWGGLVKLDSNLMRVIWNAKIPAFNLGEPLFEGNFAYVTAIGFIAKIDLKTGQYVWKIPDVYEDGHFNSFTKPYRQGGFVYFEEAVFPESRKPEAWKVKVDPKDGQFLVEKTPYSNHQ